MKYRDDFNEFDDGFDDDYEDKFEDIEFLDPEDDGIDIDGFYDDEMDDVYEKLLLQIRYIDLLVEHIDTWADEEYEESKNDMFTN